MIKVSDSLSVVRNRTLTITIYCDFLQAGGETIIHNSNVKNLLP